MDEVKNYPPYLDHPKPRQIGSNADRIRAMSDEELAKWLCSIATAECCETSCPGRELCSKGHNGLMDWLKQPAEESGGGMATTIPS